MLPNKHSVETEEQNNLQHSIHGIKEVEVDQSAFQALLEETEKVLTDDQISVKSKVKSENGEEIRVADIVQNASKRDRNCVCRICLRLTHEAECWKLFDKTRRLFCKQLREELNYIVDKINYQVCLNPVVCKECLKLIHTTYNFKKQVETVEDRIMSKLDKRVKSTIDLLSLLDENTERGSREDSKKRSCKYNESCQNESSQTTSDKCNQMVNTFIKLRDVDGDNCDILSGNKKLNMSSSVKKYESLDEYLERRKEKLGECLFEYPPRSLPKIKKRNKDRTFNSDKNIDGYIELKTEKVEDIILKYVNLVGDSVISQDGSSLEAVLEVNSVNYAHNNVTGSTINDKHSQADDVYIAGREEKFFYANQFSNLKIQVAEKQKRLLEGDCVEMSEEFIKDEEDGGHLEQDEASVGIIEDNEADEETGHSKRSEIDVVGDEGQLKRASRSAVCSKRKREYPRSFDLFDEEHDRYFEKYENGPERKLAMKWASFARRSPQFGTGPFLCPECGATFQRKLLYNNHLDEHKGEHLVVCAYCGKLVKQQRLKYHITANHQPPKHECKDCGKKFHTPQLLATHVKTMHTYKSELHQCQICGKLLRKNSIKDHVRTHDPPKIYNCDICGLNFRARSYWVRHKKRHLLTNGVPCSYCGKPFKCKDYLLQHIKQVHEQKDYNCATCGKRLSNRDALRRHLKNVHAPNRIDGRRKPKSKPKPKPPDGEEGAHEVQTSSYVNSVKVSKAWIIKQDENVILYKTINEDDVESSDVIIHKIK